LEKTKKKSTVIVTSILCVLIGVLFLYLLQRLLMPKYQRGVVEGSMIEEYYKAEESHDVVFFGDCEVYENFSPVTMYEKYGISSYLRGSAEQYIWQSYYLLEDTLRYEKPKVVVLSVHSLQFNSPRTEEYNRMTLDGMRWSKTKVDAINASMMEGESFIDYVFPILRYHYRWSELNSGDFKHLFSKDLISHNGYYMRCDVMPYTGFPPKTPLADYTLGSNAMSYLTKIADLCDKNDIKLVLIKAPNEYPFWYEQWDQQIEAFANSRNIPYVNMIGKGDEIGLDMSVDTYDAGLHMNLTGAEKLSVYFGNYLISNYQLTDYRNDSKASAIWQKKIEFYESMRDDQLNEIKTYGKLVNYGANAN